MSLDSDSSDAPVYFEIVAEVPPAAEQGKSCLSLEHVDPILQMLYCFPSNIACNDEHPTCDYAMP